MLRPRLSGLMALPRLYALGLIVAMLGGAFVAVYVAGGTRTALPHLFYLPVVVAAVYFGRRGGAAAGVVAMLLCGPVMPLDVAAGLGQTPGNWVARGAFLIAVGAMMGAAVRAVTDGFEQSLARHLHDELFPTPQRSGVEADSRERVRRVQDADEMAIVFQPVYDLRDGHVMAVEALTRFPELSPAWSVDEWFAEADRVGLGLELELACADAALQAARQLPCWVPLSINASPSLVNDPRLQGLLDQAAGRSVIIEITEHAIVDDYGALEGALDRLRLQGVRIAVDDVGAGFASLRHIVRLNPDIIKLDISLTQNVRDDHVRRAMAASLVHFARETDTLLIAEGIETQVDLATWQDIGADAVQGFLLARPASPPIDLEPRPGLARSSSWGPISTQELVHLDRPVA